MSKHTHGPWIFSIVDDFPSQIKILAKGPKYIGNIFTKDPGILDDGAIADANLIAAAPELLAALELLQLEYYKACGCVYNPKQEKMITEISKVIRKAKGGNEQA